MGGSASKVASKAPQAAAAAGRRQYPSTSSILNSATSTSNAPSHTRTDPAAYTNAPAPSEKAPAPSQVHPDPQQSPPSSTKNQHIDLDGRDPQFGASLRRLGPAIPVDNARPQSDSFPTSSTPPLGQQGFHIFPSASSSSNPSLLIVDARNRIQQQYEQESENLGRGSFGGRTLITAREISDVIRMKTAGKSDGEIEKQMRLKSGVVKTLGTEIGIVQNV